MSLRYNGINGMDWSFENLNTTTLPVLNEDQQDLNLLLGWHFQDLPDAEEISRNDYIQSIQLNRNPFIDRPDWVNYIDFSTLTYQQPALASLQSDEEYSSEMMEKKASASDSFMLRAFPNPFTDRIVLALWTNETESLTVNVHDLSGREVHAATSEPASGGRELIIATDHWPAGYYLCTVERGGEVRTLRLVK
jgi:hypothetical protein